MTEITKQAQSKQDAKPKQPKKTDAGLDDKQLDQATGGTASLMNACATGKHIPKATITT